MSRFVLSNWAMGDLEDIGVYIEALPTPPAMRVGAKLQKALNDIGQYPLRGIGQSDLTRRARVEVRSRLCSPYRIFYTVGNRIPEIIGILHTARDVAKIMGQRVQ